MALSIPSFIKKLIDSEKWDVIREIKKATYDGDPVEFDAKPVDADARGLKIEITLKLNPDLKIVGDRRWDFVGADPQEIQVDGQDMEPDDIHIEVHFSSFKFEIEYTLAWDDDGGNGHTLSLRSKRLSLFSLF